MEPLERRRLFAVTAAMSLHVLTVTGTAHADTIGVSEAGGFVTVTSGGSTIFTSVNIVRSVVIRGGGGDDAITIDSTVDLPVHIHEGGGDDAITSDDIKQTFIRTGRGNDNITGGDGNFYIAPGRGADTITLGNGEEIIHNGKGPDDVTVGNGNALIFAGAGDTVSAGASSHGDYIFSSRGADSITSTGADLIYLRPENILDGNASDTVYAGRDDPLNITGALFDSKYPRNFARIRAKFLRYHQAGNASNEP